MSTIANAIDCSRTVNDIVALHPETLRVFTDWGVDTCCGGKHPVEEVVRRHDLDGKALCDALSVAIQSR